MPRDKKAAATTGSKLIPNCPANTERKTRKKGTTDGKTKNTSEAVTKMELKDIDPVDYIDQKLKLQVNVPKTLSPDLNKFKFQGRPHIKIEFEKDSLDKEESKGLWEPPHWQEFLLNLRNMRANNDAPVDSMGCHMTMDKNVPSEVRRYQSLIALMLSSQTKDQVTFAAMERLRAKGLTVDNVLKMSDEELGQLIYPVGFWKTKVKYIKKTTQTLKELYKGDIPDSVEKLCKLTGVGPKMAHICMKVAWNKVTGIGVDTHVHRISNRIGWVKKVTTTPEDTRKALQSWLPFKLWSEVNHLMVGFGQTICTPISPICNECLNRDICPSSGKGRSPKEKSPMKIKAEIKSEDENVEMKRELSFDNNQKQKSPLKRNLTSKKNYVSDEKIKLPLNHPNIMSGPEIAVNLILTANKKTSPGNRRSTPKKAEETANKQNKDLEESESKDEIDLTIPPIKRSPRKRQVSPTLGKLNKPGIGDSDKKYETLSMPLASNYKSPKKKRTTLKINKQTHITNNHDD